MRVPKPEDDGAITNACCRDRAEERRKGLAPDYERVTADLASIVTGNTALEQDLTAISVEDSKFLGGDVEHTHLVKGLDYALLQKVRGALSDTCKTLASQSCRTVPCGRWAASLCSWDLWCPGDRVPHACPPELQPCIWQLSGALCFTAARCHVGL